MGLDVWNIKRLPLQRSRSTSTIGSAAKRRRLHDALVAATVVASSCEGAQVIRRLEAEGWALVTTKDSDRQFKHPHRVGRVTISGHLGDEMPKRTLASVKR